MKVYEGEGLASFYSRAVIDTCEGTKMEPRGKPCREIRPVVFVSTRPWMCMMRAPEVNYRFAMAEYMAMICGWEDVEWVARFNKNMMQFAEDDGNIWGAYGKRLGNPLRWAVVVDLLRRDPDTRQAVQTLWNNELDIPTSKRDHPCNTQIYYKVRDGRLDLTVFRRSADVVWGVPYDSFVFGMLLCHTASLLGVDPGVLREYIDSLHVYEPDVFYSAERIGKAAVTSTATREINYDWFMDPPNYARVRNNIERKANISTIEDAEKETNLTRFLLNV